jgi:general transcription factor 3C polypeptide 3 (transcription factor C subunit 4)
MLHCAIYTNSRRKCFECVRWFYKHFAYGSDSFRLLSAVHRVIRGTRKDYSSGPEQKFYLRQIKSFDYELLAHEERKKFKFAIADKQRHLAVGPEHSIKEHNADLLALYGHLMLVGGAADSALQFYFRAYVLRPNDPILNLCIALGYLTRAWKRQSPNRHAMVQQSFSFLNRYSQLRRENSNETGELLKLQEAEFNEALVYASLDREALAIPRLERALVLGKRLRDECKQADGKAPETSGSIVRSIEAPSREVTEPEDNFGPEAAYALRNIFASKGNMHKAHEYTKAWLVM